MTALTRRQTLIGAAATVAAATLPAVAVAEKAPDLWNGVRVIKRVVRPPLVYTDIFGAEWSGSDEFIERVKRLDEDDVVRLTDADLDEMAKAEVVTDHPYEFEDIPEIM